MLELFLFSVCVFFDEHSRFTGQQVKGEVVSLTPFYHFHLLYRHLDISQAIAAKSSSMYIASNRLFPSASRSLFLIKLKAFKSATLLKNDSNAGFSSEYCEIFKNTNFEVHLQTVAFENS